jgi:hypothetical protein
MPSDYPSIWRLFSLSGFPITKSSDANSPDSFPDPKYIVAD